MRADSRWRKASGSMKMCKTSGEELEKVSGDDEREREFTNSQEGASPCK